MRKPNHKASGPGPVVDLDNGRLVVRSPHPAQVPLAAMPASTVRVLLPVRKALAGKSPVPQYSGSYYSVTTADFVSFESRLEMHFLVECDRNRDIDWISAQPFRVTGKVDGAVRSHTPDFAILRAGKPVVVNVKPAPRLLEESTRRANALAAAVCQRLGWDFEVWSGGDDVVRANLAWLAGYRRSILFEPATLDQCLQVCTTAGADAQPVPLTVLEDAAAAVLDPSTVRPALMHLLWAGALDADLAVPLGPDTPVSVAA